MDLSNKKTDSGLLDEIKNLMDKKGSNPKKQPEVDDNFEEMIRELDEAQGLRSEPPKTNSPEKDISQKDISDPISAPNSVQVQKNQEKESDPLPSFNSKPSQDPKENQSTEVPKEPYDLPESRSSDPRSKRLFRMGGMQEKKEDIDLLVPAPPPELMQQKTPKLDVDRLMNVEEIYLNSKGKEKYGNFKVREEIDPRKPIFIKVDNYEQTLQRMIEIKTNTAEFSEILFRMENLSDSQNTNFSKLHNQLEDIQRKMIFVDTLLFEKI